MRVAALAIALALAGCKKQDKAPPPAAGDALTLTKIELERGADACADYEKQACALAAARPADAALASACQLAPSLGDAMRTALEIAQHPESARRDVLQAQDAVRKTMDSCLGGIAKLANQ